MTRRHPRRAVRGAARAARREAARGRASTPCWSAWVRTSGTWPGTPRMPLERLTLLVVPGRGGRADDAHRPAARGHARARLPGGRDRCGRDRHVGGDRGPDGARRRRVLGAAVRARRGRARRRGGVGRAARGVRPRAPARAARRPVLARLGRAARAADAQGRRRGRAAARGRPRRRPRRGARSPAAPLVGRTEADVAREVRERLVAEGHDHAEFWIVASGPNSASPHHEPGERVIAAGEPIVIDIGGTLGGYGSDITRTVWVDRRRPGAAARTRSSSACTRVLRDAQAAATAAVRPGIACEAVDAVARDAIDAAGYGPELHPPDRARHRPRGPRGPVPGGGERGAARGGRWRSAWSPGSTSRAGTAPGSRTSSSAARTGRSSSTS